MTELGYALSSEEHAAPDLVRYAQRAEGAGFTFALISDHFHPWIERQGHSPFAWTVLGGIATSTERLRVGTGVTCPLVRTHPVVVAQAAATVGELMPGRFFLGLGTGENLNEHITGERWPPASVRLEMLEEAITVIRRLMTTGDAVDHHGTHYTVEGAKVFCETETAPPIFLAAAASQSAKLAGRTSDGIIATSPQRDVLDAFDEAGGRGKPRIGQVMVCWAAAEDKAREIAHEWWPNAALPGQLGQELPMPSHFEQAVSTLSEEQVAEKVVCGPDADRHVAAIQEFVDAGFDQVYVHQIGPDQDGFFDFYEREIVERFN